MSEADPALRPSSPAQAPASPAQAAPAPETAEPEPRGKQLRKRLLMVSVPLVILAAGAWFWATSGRTVSTDNAYVKQDIVAVGSDVAGRIIEVRVRENQMVKAGDVLFVVDQQPYRVALQQADAQIANAQVEVGRLRTDYQATNVDIAGAREDVYYAQEDLKRQQALMNEGFTTRARLQQSEQALDNARTRLRTAEAEAAKAKASLASGAQVPGVNPEIAAAQAQREQAALNLQRTVVRAPVSGRISQADRLQVGQMAVQGLPLVSVVASDQVWVTANFKETDLDRMRPGQSAEIEIDAYPGTRIRGHVDSIGAGTGSEFSVLPAQNANGNWVKVTQRVPVRIAIDGNPGRPMIAGLSADVTVDIRGTPAGAKVASAR